MFSSISFESFEWMFYGRGESVANSIYKAFNTSLPMFLAQANKTEQEEQDSLFYRPSRRPTPRRPSSSKSTCSCNITTPMVLVIITLLMVAAGIYHTEHTNLVLEEKMRLISQLESVLPPVAKISESQVKAEEGLKVDEIKMDLFEEADRVTVKNLHPDNSKNGKTPEYVHPKSKTNAGSLPPPIHGREQPKKSNPMMKKFMEGVDKTEVQSAKVPELIKTLLTDGSSKNLFIPKQIWMYVQNIEKESFLVKSCIANTQRRAKESGFQVNLINLSTFQSMVKEDTLKRFTSATSLLRRESINNPVSGYDAMLPANTRDLILLELVHQFGGIAMDKSVILTENLTWLSTLSDNPYVNTGNVDFPTNYFGFFNANFTTNEEKINPNSTRSKYIMKHIGLESFFVAGVAQGEFMKEVLKMMYMLLTNPQSGKDTLNRLKIGRAVTNLFIVSNAFPISCRIVLKEKEKLDDQGLLAIDYFGIKSINSLFFPKKVPHHFEYSFEEKIFRNLAKYTLQQVEETVGPLRYMVVLPFESYINDKLKLVFKTSLPVEGSQLQLIHPASFFAQHLFPDTEKTYLEADIEQSHSNKPSQVWEGLPKIIWIEQRPQGQNSSIIEQMLYRNILRRANSSGFQVRTISSQNLDEWLVKSEMEWIKNTAEKSKIKMFPKMKMELAKLSLLIRYGGIWISRHFFALESFEWVRNIMSYPSQFVFNRFGDLPKVVLYFHPHYGQPFHWTYNQTANTKNMFNIGFDSSFIASQPDSQLLKDWIRTFTKFLTRKYGDNLAEMTRLEVATERWTVKGNAYFAMLDAVRMVMANKEKELSNKVSQDENYTNAKTAAEFYEVWSISGQQGPLKLDNSFASRNNQKGEIDPKSNTLIWRYPRSYAEGIIGPIHKLSRLYHTNSVQLMKIVEDANLTSLTEFIDQDSIFYRQLVEPVLGKLQVVDGYLSLRD